MANVVSPAAPTATVLSHRNRLRLGGTVNMWEDLRREKWRMRDGEAGSMHGFYTLFHNN